MFNSILFLFPPFHRCIPLIKRIKCDVKSITDHSIKRKLCFSAVIAIQKKISSIKSVILMEWGEHSFCCRCRYWMMFCKSHKRCIVSVFIWQIVSTLQAHKLTPFHSIWNEIHCDMSQTLSALCVCLCCCCCCCCCLLPNASLCSLIFARSLYSAGGPSGGRRFLFSSYHSRSAHKAILWYFHRNYAWDKPSEWHQMMLHIENSSVLKAFMSAINALYLNAMFHFFFASVEQHISHIRRLQHSCYEKCVSVNVWLSENYDTVQLLKITKRATTFVERNKLL